MCSMLFIHPSIIKCILVYMHVYLHDDMIDTSSSSLAFLLEGERETKLELKK